MVPKTGFEHDWSGWPGAFCINCHAEQVLELALADNWYDPIDAKFKTPEHQELQELCDCYCGWKMIKQPAEFTKIQDRVQELTLKLFPEYIKGEQK